MENDLIDGIIKAIRNMAGDETKIYLDEVKQDFVPPAFFIRTLSVMQESELKNRYRRRYSFDVEYHPNTYRNLNKPYNLKRELAELGDALLLALELVDDGTGLTLGKNLSYEVQDNVLHCFVTYVVFIERVLDKAPLMETLHQMQGVKE